MTYKNQMFVCALTFMIGYSFNFLLPIDLFAGQFSRGEYLKGQGSLSENIKSDKNNFRNVSVVDENKKNIEKSRQTQLLQSLSPPVIEANKIENNKDLSNCNDIAALQNELSMLRNYRMQAEINKHSEYLQSVGGNSFDALSDHFRREPIDIAWARDKENVINNAIEQDKYLSQMPHLTSECRSKQCKFSVLSDDQFYLDKLSESLNKVVASHEASFSSYSTVVDDKTHTTNIYFDRH